MLKNWKRGNPVISGGHFLPPADNTYDLGSTSYAWRSAYIDTVVYSTSVTGNWSPSAAGTYSLGTTTYEWQGLYLGDNTGVYIGLTQDSVFYHRTAVLNADTGITGVLVGASQDTTALAANSLIISNVTTDGDILIAVSDGGHSKQMIFLDGDTGITHIGKPGTPGTVSSSGDVYFAGAVEIDGILTAIGITANGNIQVTPTGSMYVKSDGRGFYLGAGEDAIMKYQEEDTDAKCVVFWIDESQDGGNNVPVWAFGERTNLDNANLGLFDAFVQPLVTVVDNDADSWFGITFSADDTPHLDCGGAATLIGINKGLTLSGSIATAIDFAGTYTGNVIDFSNTTIAPAGSDGPCLIRAGSYGTPIDVSTDADQSGMIRLYQTTSGTGTSYDRGVFVCLKTTGVKNVMPIAGLAEIGAQAGAGPTNVHAAEFIVNMNTSTSAIGVSNSGSAGMAAVWAKIGSSVGSATNASSVIAPLWLDNQMNGTVNGEEYACFITCGTSPDAVFGFEVTAGVGWGQLFYFDDTCYNVAPVSGSGLKVLLNATQKYIFLMDSATQQVDADFGNTPNSGDTDTDDLIDKMRDALITFGLVAAS